MSEQFEVFAKPGSPGGQPRRVFSGDEAAARQYVADNFPRLHVEPGTDYGDQTPVPDAVLVNPGGNVSQGTGVEHYVGGEWVNPEDSSPDDPDVAGTRYEGHNVKDLRGELHDRGLSTTGNKGELQQRLIDDDNAKE